MRNTEGFQVSKPSRNSLQIQCKCTKYSAMQLTRMFSVTVTLKFFETLKRNVG